MRRSWRWTCLRFPAGKPLARPRSWPRCARGHPTLQRGNSGSSGRSDTHLISSWHAVLGRACRGVPTARRPGHLWTIRPQYSLRRALPELGRCDRSTAKGQVSKPARLWRLGSFRVRRSAFDFTLFLCLPVPGSLFPLFTSAVKYLTSRPPANILHAVVIASYKHPGYGSWRQAHEGYLCNSRPIRV